jgi:2'-5' RNA ligase
LRNVDSLRTFIAIELPTELRRRVVEHIDRLRRELPDVRASWLREDNLHLTLKFLGDVPLTRIADVSAAAARATQAIAPFELMLSGCGAFPPHGRPKVLWIGIESGTQASGLPDLGTQVSGLPDLHAALEHQLATAEFPHEARPFHPHLTIARLRQPSGGRELSDFHKRLGIPPQSFVVSEIVVFRSELLREGSRHTAISRHELSK